MEAQTKTQNQRTMLKHGGAPLVAQGSGLRARPHMMMFHSKPQTQASLGDLNVENSRPTPPNREIYKELLTVYPGLALKLTLDF